MDLADAVEQQRRELQSDPVGKAQAKLTDLHARHLRASRELEELENAERRREEERLARDSALEAERRRYQREDQDFWFRRFITSLAIAHGAGFAAVASKLLDGNVSQSTAAAAWHPMAAFAAGMVFAGVAPVALWWDAFRVAVRLVMISALLLIIALSAALIAVWNKGELTLTPQAEALTSSDGARAKAPAPQVPQSAKASASASKSGSSGSSP